MTCHPLPWAGGHAGAALLARNLVGQSPVVGDGGAFVDRWRRGRVRTDRHAHSGELDVAPRVDGCRRGRLLLAPHEGGEMPDHGEEPMSGRPP